jgi:predicted nucleic acid-binding protein
MWAGVRRKPMIKIYLDNCCYNRPYDDQQQMRIQLETQAKLYIQELIKERKLSLVCSFVSRYENNENPDTTSSDSISAFLKYSTDYIDSGNYDEIYTKALKLMNLGIKMKDASHLACAIKAKCDCLLTTDDKFIKNYTEGEIKVINPINFLQIFEGEINA